jgi:uncharacterized membrane protein YfcA
MPDFAQMDFATVFWTMLPFIAVGFAAQMVDGALGMAFGVITNTALVVFLGLPPRLASATVHAVETFTTAASGVSHILHRNVDWKLFVRLVIPGMIGGVLGAYVLSSIDAEVAKPFVMVYLASIGLYLLYRAWRGRVEPREPRIVEPLGLIGGFLDAAGGGGWGPVVTSNLLVQGAQPRKTISATFIFTIGFAAFTVQAIGILIGGVAAAPFGAVLAKRVPARPLMGLIGGLLTATSAYSVWAALT